MPDGGVLVTGGAGFIGSRLVMRLREAGRPVTVLDALVPSVHGRNATKPDLHGSRFVHGDVRDPAAWRDALRDQPELIFHLAAETGTGESMYKAVQYMEANVTGTAVLCDLITAGVTQPARVIVASSRAVYGEGPYRRQDGSVVYPDPRSVASMSAGRWEPLDPDTGEELAPIAVGPWARTQPSSAYGLTKLTQEQILHLLLPPLGVESVALRLQNVYGPGQSLTNPYTGILSIFSVQLLNDEGVRIFEDGRESRDFVFVDDVVEAFWKAGTAAVPGNPVTVDIGGGEPTSVLAIGRALCERCDRPVEDYLTITGEFRVGDIRHAFADLTGAREVLQWAPKVDLSQGLDRLLSWIRAGSLPESTLGAALAEMEEVGLLRQAEPGSS